jgi:hypothetical protein
MWALLDDSSRTSAGSGVGLDNDDDSLGVDGVGLRRVFGLLGGVGVFALFGGLLGSVSVFALLGGLLGRVLEVMFGVSFCFLRGMMGDGSHFLGGVMRDRSDLL